MKLVVAIVRPEKLADVLEALFRAEVRASPSAASQGHGGEMERVENYRGTTVKMELSEKVRLEIGVSDHFVEPTVKAILGRGPHRARSATARSSCCRWRRSTGSAPVRRTRRRSRRWPRSPPRGTSVSLVGSVLRPVLPGPPVTPTGGPYSHVLKGESFFL